MFTPTVPSSLWRSTWLYYLSLIIPVVGNLGLFYILFYSDNTSLSLEQSGVVLFSLKFFWLTGAVVALTNIIGLIWFGNPEHNNRRATEAFARNGWPKALLIVVYVSRGDNVHALTRSIKSSRNLLKRLEVTSRIDVVTDLPVKEIIGTDGDRVTFHLVPNWYNTPKRAKWKARALHYVVEQHRTDATLHDNGKPTWILHLDEESQLTESVIAGIATFINEPTNQHCIGQGEIKYNAHNYGHHLLITWADSIRSGDDLGRFRFQYTLFGRPLFGMHGSFILVPLAIEQRFGFDLGGKGSVTEDAYFALTCGEAGIRFRWVHGYIREQSPYTISALIKQRRRWFSGLLTLSFDREISLRTRLPLMVNTLLWSFAWLGPIVTIVTLMFGGYFPTTLLLLAAFLQGSYTATYVIGAARNLADHDVRLSPLHRLCIYGGAPFAVTIVNTLEGIAVLYALIKPVRTFDVVNKN